MTAPDGAGTGVLGLSGLSAFRDGMYTRMEEISFRTSMTVLAGVVAFAAVVASVSVLMSESSGPPRHAALSRPATASAPAGPTSAPVSSGRAATATPSTSPARVTPAPTSRAQPAVSSPPPVTAARPAAATPAVPTPTVSPSLARISSQTTVATWWSWWLRVHHGNGLPSGGRFSRLSRTGGRPGRR